jgi:signal transduction histidine kinase
VTRLVAWALRQLDRLPRPLDPTRSIKIKLGILLLAAGAAGMGVFIIGIGWFPMTAAVIATTVGLATVQILAHGMTSPLRDMTTAARAMARGDYGVRVRATSRDEVGQLAHAFNQMSAELAAADQQRRELIANVSHELRTPITAMQGILENIVDGVAEPDPAAMQAALAQTERLGRLVTELLDLSRVDAGVTPLDVSEFDLAELFAEVVAEAKAAGAARGRDVEFVTRTTPAGLTGVADRARLHQVVTNLVDNAARHSPPGGTVLLAGRRDEPGLVLEVTDEGPGIARELRERVFERFTRGDRGSGGGTGLGLAIAHWVVQLHGGTIAVVDPLDRPTAKAPGCHIRVVLPA